eukprot:8928353-Ditylum_brightwellii.AAC.1
MQTSTRDLMQAKKDSPPVAPSPSYNMGNVHQGIYTTDPPAPMFTYGAPSAPFPLHISQTSNFSTESSQHKTSTTETQVTPTLIPGQLITSKNKIMNKNLRTNKRFGGDKMIRRQSLKPNCHETRRYRIYYKNGEENFRIFKIEGTSSNKGCIGDYQPGGVCIIARGDIVGRFSDVGSDSRDLGCWSYFVMNGKQGKNCGSLQATMSCKIEEQE